MIDDEKAAECSLVLRLAGPLQSWGNRSEYNRRETANEPTKSGVLGLLAAALGRRRADPIEDLLHLQLGVRTDRPGQLLRDYHTASDYRGNPLPSAAVLKTGKQKPTSPVKHTAVTQRFYLADSVFVAAVHGPTGLLTTLAEGTRGGLPDTRAPVRVAKSSAPHTRGSAAVDRPAVSRYSVRPAHAGVCRSPSSRGEWK